MKKRVRKFLKGKGKKGAKTDYDEEIKENDIGK